MSASASVAEFLAKKWFEFYKKSPLIAVTLSICVLSFGGIVIYQADKHQAESYEKFRRNELNYRTQIEQLDRTEDGIRGLLVFIEQQKQDIKQIEDTMASLRREREELKPIVESERSIVEAIFRAQEQRNEGRVWRERGIGFGFGILASFIASVIWAALGFIIKRKKESAQPVERGQ